VAPPSDGNENYIAHFKEQSLLKKTLKTASKSGNKRQHNAWSNYAPLKRTHGAPDSERDNNSKKLETKASSSAGQCIPAGCRVTLPRRVLIITMRSRRFAANSASDCLRFAKFRPQFSESCGATYIRVREMFSALQSASGSLTSSENSVQIDA